jgi:hypothetical protein
MQEDDEYCATCGGPYGGGPPRGYTYCPECDTYWGDEDE